MTPGERAQIIAQLQAAGESTDEDTIQLAYEHPVAYGIEGIPKGGGRETPFSRARKEMKNVIRDAYGPQVADIFMSLVSSQFQDEGKSDAEQENSLPGIKAAIVNGGFEATAIEKDRLARRGEFLKLARTALLPPVATGSPQDNVTLAAIDGLLGKYADEYEQDYQNLLAQGVIPSLNLMADAIESTAAGIMPRARPDLKSTNSVSIMTKIRLQENAAVVGTEARRIAQAAKDFDEYKEYLQSKVGAASNAFGQDDTGVKAALETLRWTTLMDPALRDQFVELNKLTPTPANVFLDGIVGPKLGRAVSNTPLAGTLVEGDVAGTLAGIRDVPGQQEARARLAGTLLNAEAANPNLDFSGIDIDAILAGGTKVDPAKQLQAEIKKITQAPKVEAAKVKAENYGQDANRAFAQLPPDVQARLRSRFGPDVAAAIFQQAKGDPQRAADLFKDEVEIAGDESKRAGGYRDIFGEANFFDQARLSEGLRSKLAAGSYLDETDAAAVAQAHRFYGAFENSLNPDGGTPEERRANAASAAGALWKQSGGDAAKYQEALKARMFATPEVEQAWRSTLQGFKTREEAMAGGFKLPAGGLTGRASLAFQASQTPAGTPEREALMEQIKRADDEEARAAVGRGPRPYRGRKK